MVRHGAASHFALVDFNSGLEPTHSVNASVVVALSRDPERTQTLDRLKPPVFRGAL